MKTKPLKFPPVSLAEHQLKENKSEWILDPNDQFDNEHQDEAKNIYEIDKTILDYIDSLNKKDNRDTNRQI